MTLETPKPDRRAHARQTVHIVHVEIGDGDTACSGLAKDISRAGMFVETSTPKDVGCEFIARFDLPGSGSSIKCRCRVVWYRKNSDGSDTMSGMGLVFEDMDLPTKDKIGQWLTRCSEA